LLERLSLAQNQPLHDGNASNAVDGGREAILVSEIDTIGWGRVVSVDQKLESLTIRVGDCSGREYHIAVILPSNYPVAPPICDIALPVAFEPRWEADATNGRLLSAIEQVSRVIDGCSALFDELDAIDASCWVLDPERPVGGGAISRGCTYRRLAVGEDLSQSDDSMTPGERVASSAAGAEDAAKGFGVCSVELVLTATAPRVLPEGLRFFGPEKRVAPLRGRLNSRLQCWNQGC
jgi:hypothetical protein